MKEITDKDHLVFRAPYGTKDDKGVNALYAEATFADDSLFDKLEELKGDVEDAVNDLEDSATATEKLEAAKKAAKDGVATLQNEYKLLVDNAKSLAPSMVDDLIEGVTNEKYTEEDSTKDAETAKAAIEAATTLEEISKVVNEHACKDGTKVIFAEGALTTLTLRKQTALEGLQDAYETLITKEDWLDPEANKNAEEAYDAMVTLLAQYGVSVETLPGAVYEEYASKVSAATELPLNDKNEIALQKEGVDAINDTYDGVKEKLVEGIVASYTKEIDDAKSLSSSPNAKVTLKGVIEATVSNFVNEDKDNSKTIESYVDATITYTEGTEPSASGLIGRIEIALENAVVANGLQAFKAERIENAVAVALETLNAQAEEIAAKDSLYGSIFGAPVYQGQKLVGFKSVANVLTWDKEYANPYLASGKTVNEDGYVEVGADLGKESVYSKVKNSNPSLYASIVSTYEGQLKSCANVAAVKQNLQEALTRQSARYKDVVADFKTRLGDEYLPKKLESENYVKVANITTSWTNNKLSTMEDLASAAEGLQTAGKALGTLDKKVHAFVTTVEEGYEDFFKAEENNVSTFKEAFDDMVDDIISGEASVSTVNRFTTNSNLTSLYDADVANFLSETKNWLNQKYQNLISDCTVQESVVYGKQYNELLSFIGHKVVKKEGTATGYVIKDSATSGAIDLSCKTITSVNAFIDLTTEVLGAEENPRQLISDIQLSGASIVLGDVDGDGSAYSELKSTIVGLDPASEAAFNDETKEVEVMKLTGLLGDLGFDSSDENPFVGYMQLLPENDYSVEYDITKLRTYLSSDSTGMMVYAYVSQIFKSVTLKINLGNVKLDDASYATSKSIKDVETSLGEATINDNEVSIKLSMEDFKKLVNVDGATSLTITGTVEAEGATPADVKVVLK